MAIPRAARTKTVSLTVAADQPTVRREKVSTTNAT
jgi:CTP:molybdopterin cytidylyltransferase MocA